MSLEQVKHGVPKEILCYQNLCPIWDLTLPMIQDVASGNKNYSVWYGLERTKNNWFLEFHTSFLVFFFFFFFLVIRGEEQLKH